jgi:hypothetical protein
MPCYVRCASPGTHDRIWLIKYKSLSLVTNYNDVIGRDDRFPGPQPIFKITDLDTVDDNF